MAIPWTSSSRRSLRFSSFSRTFSCSGESNGSDSGSFSRMMSYRELFEIIDSR
jgi:hypothetical protein